MEQDNVKWIYNKAKHEVVEQPTIERPLKTWYEHEFDAGDKEFNKKFDIWQAHIDSRRHISVNGTVDFKDGQEVVQGVDYKLILTGEGVVKNDEGEYDLFFYAEQLPKQPIIKQEQPQPFDFEKLDADIKAMFPMGNQSQEQQPIEDIELHENITLRAKIYANSCFIKADFDAGFTDRQNQRWDCYFTAHKAALLQQAEHTPSEIITGYIHEIDSLRETNRKLGEQLKLEQPGALIKRFGEVIVERDKLKKELEQEQFNHLNTRRSWDATLKNVDKLKLQSQPEIPEDIELEIVSYDYSIDRINNHKCPITAQSDVQAAYKAGFKAALQQKGNNDSDAGGGKILPKLEKGDKIKLYGTETTVKGFEVLWNDGLTPPRYEIILLTTGRGDPFERSLDVIETIPKK